MSSDKHARIRAAIIALTNTKQRHETDALIEAVVKKVNGTDSVDCEAEGITYHEVLLHPTLSAKQKGVTLIPKKDSNVLIANIEEGTNYVVILVDEVDKIIGNIAGSEFLIDKNGFTNKIGNCELKQTAKGFEISNNGQNLGSLLGDLCTALSVLTVTCATPASPSSTPVNLADFITISAKLKTLLK
jgi:hypothetical protein